MLVYSDILNFHCFSHTFATTVTLSNGMPIESVSKILGYQNYNISLCTGIGG
ncbi:hypothetical protein J4E06_02235 [Muricauda sp. NFXS6]|uniref:hypothetical protein n=1 Tax=Allomuricauda sp. NFXS6 TaxID=2819094 RepID=UPI0032DFFB0A